MMNSVLEELSEKPPFINVSDVMELLGMGRKQTIKFLKREGLVIYTNPRTLRVPTHKLANYLKKQFKNPPTKPEPNPDSKKEMTKA